MPFYLWSKTSAANANADPTINFAEGQPPASYNDSARALMAATAQWRDDVSGTIVTAGTSTAYTLSSNQVFTSLALMNGAMIAFVPHTTNGATVTLNVDGLGPKPLRSSPGIELSAGTLIQGTPYPVTYNNSDGAFYLQGFFSTPSSVPIGGFVPFLSTTVPNSNFALPFGQSISTTTYATLFSMIGTTFGTGGAGTFNLPDLRGRAIFGLDNMGGIAANRITVAGGNYDGTTLGTAGGGQNHTLTTAEIPTGLHTLNFNDPQHSHSFSRGINQNLAKTSLTADEGLSTDAVTGSGPVTIDSASTGITASLTDHAGGGSHTSMPPSMALPILLRVI